MKLNVCTSRCKNFQLASKIIQQYSNNRSNLIAFLNPFAKIKISYLICILNKKLNIIYISEHKYSPIKSWLTCTTCIVRINKILIRFRKKTSKTRHTYFINYGCVYNE